MRNKPGTAIVGLGLAGIGKQYSAPAARLAADAVAAAVEDSGLSLGQVDGLLFSRGAVASDLGLRLPQAVGLGPLRLLAGVEVFGASAVVMVQQAAQAIQSGQAEVVVCVFADAPLAPGRSAGSVYGESRHGGTGGWAALRMATGPASTNLSYALAARRHMHAYGTTSAQLGAVAISQRANAALNPLAQMRAPISIEDHQSSRMIADPLHLLDCCLVSNGAVAVVVTSADRAADCAQPPVHIWGWGAAHPTIRMQRGSEFGLRTGAAVSGTKAMQMAGITPADVQIAELYDCYTFTVVVQLEDYGFCAKGEGGPFAASGALSRTGSLPVNTGGGQLSSYYLWGMTPLSEAIIQARGQAGERQVARREMILVSGNGGVLEFHSTLILSPLVRS